MEPQFELKPIDRQFYEQRLAAFLPKKIIDIHTHVWLDNFKSKQKEECLRSVTWPRRVAVDNSIEGLISTYEVMFPGKAVLPLIFGSTSALMDDIHGGNAYVQECAAQHNLPALIFADPRWGEREFEERISSGHFLEAKVDSTLSDPALPIDEFLAEYSRAGDTHHSALVYGDVAEEVANWGKRMRWPTLTLR